MTGSLADWTVQILSSWCITSNLVNVMSFFDILHLALRNLRQAKLRAILR